MTDGSGPSSRAPFARYDRDSSSWKMCQVSFPWTTESDPADPTSSRDPSAPSSPTPTARLLPKWPKQGIACGGRAYELPTREHPIAGSASSSSASGSTTSSAEPVAQRGGEEQTWPTPTSSMDTMGDVVQAMYAGSDPRRPAYQDANWPTPTTQDSENDGQESQRRRRSPPLNARVAMAAEEEKATALWPTPTVEDAGRSGSQEMADRWAAGERVPDTHQRLRTAVLALWPTPKAQDAENAMRGARAQGGPSLGEQVREQTEQDALWPTPTASDQNGAGHGLRGAGKGPALTTAVALWPTPVASDCKRGEVATPEKPGQTRSLGHAVVEERVEEQRAPTTALWPTPVTTDAKGSRRSTARTDEWESHEGTTLLDAVLEAEGRADEPRDARPAARLRRGTSATAPGPGEASSASASEPTPTSLAAAAASPTAPTTPAAVSRTSQTSLWDEPNETSGPSAPSAWPTPTTVETTSEKAKHHRPTAGPHRGGPSFGLGDAVSMWPTPTAATYGSSQNGINGVNGENRRPSAGTPSLETRAKMEGGALNPDWVEALMGFPAGWTDVPLPHKPRKPKKPREPAEPAPPRGKPRAPRKPRRPRDPTQTSTKTTSTSTSTSTTRSTRGPTST